MPSGQQVLYLGGKVLVSGPSDTKTLADLGLADDDVVTLEKALPEGEGQRSSVAAPRMNADGSCENPEQLMALLSQDPVGLQRLPPSIRETIESNNVEGFQKALIELTAARKKAAEEEARFMRLAAEDPMNPEVQAKLEEVIQQKNIAENFENAIEHNPEAFASVVMLYVNMEVNGSPLKAFVDSGAQMTIMCVPVMISSLNFLVLMKCGCYIFQEQELCGEMWHSEAHGYQVSRDSCRCGQG